MDSLAEPALNPTIKSDVPKVWYPTVYLSDNGLVEHITENCKAGDEIIVRFKVKIKEIVESETTVNGKTEKRCNVNLELHKGEVEEDSGYHEHSLAMGE